MKTTIADIALRAGVSKATVSRVLNDKAEGVGAETRQKIKDLIIEMDFEPSGFARSLATGKSRALGLVVPDIADPFCPLLIRGIENALAKAGYGLFLCDSNRDIAREKDHIRRLLERRVDGIILNSTLSDCDCQLDLLEKRAIPYVLLDRMIETRAGGSGVYVDNRKGAKTAAGYLLSGRTKHLLFLNGPESLFISRLRRDGVDEACREHGIAPEAVIHLEGDYTAESGERIIDAFLAAHPGKPPFDAIFAANDLMAIGAMLALKSRGIRIPEDVELIGFDDVAPARYVDPPLSTIAQPAFEMGKKSAELLLGMIGGKKPRKRVIVMEPSLVLRGSTGQQ